MEQLFPQGQEKSQFLEMSPVLPVHWRLSLQTLLHLGPALKLTTSTSLGPALWKSTRCGNEKGAKDKAQTWESGVTSSSAGYKLAV